MAPPIQDPTLSGRAHDKAFSPLPQRLQEFSPVPAAVDGPETAPLGGGAPWIDGREDVLVLADQLLGPHRKKLRVQRREVVAAGRHSADTAKPGSPGAVCRAASTELVPKMQLS